MVKLQRIMCIKCGEQFTENEVGRDELIHVESVNKIIDHSHKRGHRIVVMKFTWPSKRAMMPIVS